MPSAFGTTLRNLRTAASLSQAALAEAAQISTAAVGAYEQGTRTAPHRETVSRLAEALGLTGEALRDFKESARRRRRSVSKQDSTSQDRAGAVPSPRSSLIGRESDVAAIKELLGRERIVTITGSAGIGKTRLAIQVAADLASTFADGVAFVDLGPLSDGELVLGRLAAALGLVPPHRSAPIAALVEQVRGRSVLLIFDNCEHLLSEAATAISALVAGAVAIRVLATSRERMSIRGETTYRLPSLAIPTRSVSAAEALSYAAVRLLAERAAKADRRFVMTDARVEAVVDVCRLLDGIPLALELAAARMPYLGPSVLRDQIRRRITILSGGNVDAPARQRTIEAAVAWSYDLLDDDERRVLRGVSVFAGGWTLDAAQAVCGDTDTPREQIIEVLSSLVDKSLVTVRHGADVSRYDLLHITRMFAWMQASRDGDLERNRRRHAAWVADVARKSFERTLLGTAESRLVAAELQNVRAALAWALSEGEDIPMAGEIIANAGPVWRMNSLLSEQVRFAKKALERIDVAREPVVAGKLFRTLAVLSVGPEKIEAGERALELFSSVDDTLGTALTYSALATAHVRLGKIERADQLADEAMRRFAQLNMSETLAFAVVCNTRKEIEERRRDFDEAWRWLMTALRISRKHADEGFELYILVSLGTLEFARGNAPRALIEANTAIDAARRLGARNDEVYLLCNRALFHVAVGKLDAAQDDAMLALDLLGNDRTLVVTTLIQHMTTVGALRGQATASARLLGYVDAWFSRLRLEREQLEQYGYDRARESLKAQLAPNVFEEHVHNGSMLDAESALREAKALDKVLRSARRSRGS